MQTCFVWSNFITRPSVSQGLREYKRCLVLRMGISNRALIQLRNKQYRRSFVPNVGLYHPEKMNTISMLSKSDVPKWKYKLLYDGQCPLCQKEVAFLQKHDNQRGIICFVDISQKNYSPNDNAGIDYKTAMGRIHAIRNDGLVLRDVDVFRAVYDALGIGWIYFPTKLPVIRQVTDLLYQVWAKFRLPLTGRKSIS